MLDTERGYAAWAASDAWDAASPELGRSGAEGVHAGVILRPLRHVDMANIVATRGATAALDRLAEARWGFAPPSRGRARFSPRGGLIWSGPGQWLALDHPAGALDGLAGALAGVAAVTAQGDGRALVEIDGLQARRMLAKCLSIDLHPAVFTPGSAASTALAHTSVQLWSTEGAPFLTLCVPRTMAGSVWRILTASAAEYGLLVERR